MIGRPYKADMLEMLNQLTGGQVIFIDDNLKAFRGVPSSISCFWINRAGVARSSDLPSHVIEIETLADTRLLELCR
ncbi:MAG TPA: hypothetical protein ENN64_00965 [bacterium]|nr:hypothetical protein [bacterium]